MEITTLQRQLMEHTIKGSNRNWFGTSLGCEDNIEFKKLVSAGLSISETPPKWMEDEVIYRLTPDGKRRIL